MIIFFLLEEEAQLKLEENVCPRHSQNNQGESRYEHWAVIIGVNCVNFSVLVYRDGIQLLLLQFYVIDVFWYIN